MKQMTEQEAFEGCVKMWKWIIKQLDKGRSLGVERLKIEYCKKHNLELTLDCFFCEHCRNMGTCKEFCLLYKYGNIGCCGSGLDYESDPHGFYKVTLKAYAKFQESNK